MLIILDMKGSNFVIFFTIENQIKTWLNISNNKKEWK